MKVAVVREEDCVGCMKCIPACPVDAIVGSAKFLHTVLTDECIGCGLCVAPCPMDCIEMVETAIADGSELKAERAEKARKRYKARQQRLILNTKTALLPPKNEEIKQKMQSEILAAIQRVTDKRKSSTNHV